MNKKEDKDMFYTNKSNIQEDNLCLLKIINQKIDEINKMILKSNLLDLSELLGNRKKLLIRNITSGIAKGVGIGIGVTLITAILVVLLQKIVTLNIPVIGEYIADIVDIVERSR